MRGRATLSCGFVRVCVDVSGMANLCFSKYAPVNPFCARLVGKRARSFENGEAARRIA